MRLQLLTLNNQEVRIAEHKVDYINKLIDLAEQTTVIKELWLFGSVLEERCTDISDIDMVLVGDLTRTLFWRSKEIKWVKEQLFNIDIGLQQYDILYFRENKDKACGAIREAFDHGVCIYKRVG